MKNAFGGLLNEKRHWTHPVIHETLVDLLMIQMKRQSLLKSDWESFSPNRNRMNRMDRVL
jgi:hypothetical protein